MKFYNRGPPQRYQGHGSIKAKLYRHMGGKLLNSQIVRLKHVDEGFSLEIGGKAGNLARLKQEGMPVPDAWVIPAEAFREHLARHGLEAFALSVAETPDEERCSQLRWSILGTGLSADLLESFADLPDVALAVRSSASVEDGARGSYSGLFKTCLGVKKGSGLIEAVKEVWASVFTPQALSYHRQVSQARDYPLMAVLIVPLLDAKTSGVAFSASPVDGNPFQIVVTACLGLGTTVVDGVGDCDRYVLDLDSLEVLEANAGRQRAGDFVGPDGSVQTRQISPDQVRGPILSEAQLRQLGEAVRSIDDFLERRVDVEFAFHAGGLSILQAREIVGLPSFFPDNPAEKDELVGCGHQTWGDPLPPFLRVHLRTFKHPQVPPPPWPLETEEVFFHLGRIFGRGLPQTPDDDHTFLRRMEALYDPERYVEEWWPWTRHAYQHIIPDLRDRSERVLSLSENELGSLNALELGQLLHDTIDLESQAGAFYVSSSKPTSRSLTWIQVLIYDWLTAGDWRKADVLAVDVIQGAPKLTHERDAELQAVAWGEGDMDVFVKRWGYSYMARDEMHNLTKWRSWREDPGPLHTAIKQMQVSRDRRPIRQLIEESIKKRDETLDWAMRTLRAGDPEQGEKRARIFAACVKTSIGHFPMKDDRDIVLSHAQSALRWVLTEAGRRLQAAGIVRFKDEVFLLEPQELIEYFSGCARPPAELTKVVETRRREQARLSRYTLSLTRMSNEKGSPDGQMLQGYHAAPGIAEGRACVVSVDAPVHIADLKEGEILVLKGEGKLGWTMFFSNIAGLVYETGNWLCHESNLCRELGKPAVVCLGDKIDLIQPGERLRIDGGKGTVHRLGFVE